MDLVDQLDFGPLTRGATVAERLRALRSNVLALVAAVLASLLVVVPAAVLAGLVVTGRTQDKGGLAFGAMLIASGFYLWWSVLRGVGGGAALQRFASANELDFVPTHTPKDYAGTLFNDGTATVYASVRTPGALFVEVGDRMLVGPVPGKQPQVFLRARLLRAVGPGVSGRGIVDRPLRQRITRFAGDFTVDLVADELTLFGAQPLRPEQPGRVREAFALAAELTDRTNAVVRERSGEPAGAVTAGVPPGTLPPVWPRQGAARASGPKVVLTVLVTIGMIVLGGFGVALVMSAVDDSLRGDRALAQLATVLLGAAALAGVGGVVRWLLSGRTPRPPEDRPAIRSEAGLSRGEREPHAEDAHAADPFNGDEPPR